MKRKILAANQLFVRRVNVAGVMEAMRLFAPLSRAELSSHTGLNPSTISSIISELIDSNFIQETTFQDEARVGRPGMLLTMNPNGGCAVGFEIGVDFLSAILTNFTAQVLWRRRFALPEDETQVSLLEKSEALVSEALEYGQNLGLKPLGIGIGVPGLVDTLQGKLVFAPNLHWKEIPIRLIFSNRFQLPVFVENEANSGALGEYFYGAARGKDDYIYLSTGIGLGGGIMIGGKLFKGSNGYAGEIGHTTIYEGGEICGCGSRGCWETYVGPRYMIRRIRQTLEEGQPSVINNLLNGDLNRLTVDTVVEAAKDRDQIALSALREVGGHLGVGISNLINIFNPELVVVGGALSPASPWLIPIIQDQIRENALQPLIQTVKIIPSQLGVDSCVIGAVALVLDNVMQESFNLVIP
ncbi:MAG TPA: ROK family transcriptional regulator [Anaerolineaceae bacterium]|nr:ROK family transcriptional regulator [Anaerolineaceae bacterium]